MAADPLRQEIFDLCVEATRAGRLAPDRERRLRELIAPWNRHANDMPWEDVLSAAFVAVGAWMRFEPETIDVFG